MWRRRSGRSHSNFEPLLTPGGGRRDAGCRNSRRQESRGSRSDDAAQHGITVVAVAVMTVVAAHGCAVAAPAAAAAIAVPAVAVAAGVGTAASAFRGRRLLHYAPRGAPRALPALARLRLSLALPRVSHYSDPSSTRRRLHLGAADFTRLRAIHLTRLRPPDPRTGNGEVPRFPRSRTGACPRVSTPTSNRTRADLSSCPAHKIRARVPVRPLTHAPCQQRERSRSILNARIHAR